MTKSGPYRDGVVHVLAEKCSTCVFRSGNPMHLRPGRLADLVRTNLADDSALTCHQTLPYNSSTDAEPSVCRGYFDAYRRQVTPLRLAVALDALVEDPPPIKKEKHV